MFRLSCQYDSFINWQLTLKLVSRMSSHEKEQSIKFHLNQIVRSFFAREQER